LIRLHDDDAYGSCSGKDTTLTFIQPYEMAETQTRIDSTVRNAFRQTRHNFINDTVSNLSKITACQVTGTNAYIRPVVSLNQDSILCQGSSRELLAGTGYSSYLWSDGSSNATLKITSPGKYWVSVMDEHGCQGSDTTTISGFASSPANFLPKDTSICLPGKLTISPLQSFQNYQWNDQSTQPSLIVDQPGIYWLQVTDSNNCSGVDTIALTGRPCTQNLSVPNAFTPNGDGRNDLLRPLLFGNVVKFRFSVYNRWGQRVFETSTLMQGWDGKLGGIAEATGVYVWYCEYQLEGAAEKSEQGTLLLIR
jgi:gliding motility-associated-like protein